MKINKIIKPKRFARFTIIPTAIFRFKNISIGATGLYAYLFSHNINQEITVTFICNHFKDGRDAINNRLKELIDSGFLIREKVRIKGKFVGTNYILNDIPQTEKPQTEKPRVVNPEQSNTNNIYTNNKSNISTKNEMPNKFSETSKKAFNYFVQLFPEKNKPQTKAQKTKWLDCLDKIERLDKYDLRDVYAISRDLRNDTFWKNNFLSILKLRNIDKNGIKYIDRFMIAKDLNVNDVKKKIQGAIKFYKYNETNGNIAIGVKTINGDIDYTMLKTMLDKKDIDIILNNINDI